MGTIEVARLHDRGVQIEIVRHHGGAEDSDSDVEHAAITENLRRGDKEPLHDAEHARPRKKNYKAEPNTSARSQAAIAISANPQNANETLRLKWSRQAWARSRPVTTPNLMARLCSRTAIKLDSMTTESKV